MGKKLRFNPGRRRRGKTRNVPPARFKPRPPGWRDVFVSLRPWLLLIGFVTMAYIFTLPGAFSAPGWLSSEPQVIEGRFTRCGRGRGYYCVVDGDTFKLGDTSVRVVGIDTAEVDAECPAEAVQAEASTEALQGWLNRGPFRMTHRLDEPIDRYGRSLRTVYRLRPDGSEDRLADFMRREGGARGYWGGGRGEWC
ncbi:thermonuclease family protein [Qipengyuania flava]|uniref:thermonuclease family protein n=1 Tax=Qipengyuania flava TaxID=192812 RepID=UPI00321BA235